MYNFHIFYRAWPVLLVLAVQAGVAQQTTLFENGMIITGDGGLIESGSVLVEGGVISAVGDATQFTIPVDSSVIDLGGRVLMPAMIDAHAHLGYQSPEDWGADNYSTENLQANLRQYAYYGFAAAFSAGSDPDDLALALQAEQASNSPAAARFLFAAGMGPPGQGPNDAFLLEIAKVREHTRMTVLRGVDSPGEAEQQVREVAEKGIGFIKIWVDDRGGSQQKLSPEYYQPLIAEARRQRIDVLVHQQYPADMPPLLEAGVSGFLHGRLGPQLDVDIAAATAAAGAFIVPNLGLAELRRETLGRDPFLQPVLAQDVVARLSQVSAGRQTSLPLNEQLEQELKSSMTRLLTAGVDIVLGTDAGALPDHPFGYSGHRELEIFVRLGMTPMQAIVAATGNAARHLRQDDLGMIAVGRRADMIVLSDNPLQDIANTQTIEAVYLNGELLDRESIAAQLRGEAR